MNQNKDLDKRLAQMKNPPFSAILHVFGEKREGQKDTFYGFYMTVKAWEGAIVDCGTIEWDARYFKRSQATKLGRQIAKNFGIKISNTCRCSTRYIALKD